jgi:hypothetical protein
MTSLHLTLLVSTNLHSTSNRAQAAVGVPCVAVPILTKTHASDLHTSCCFLLSHAH